MKNKVRFFAVAACLLSKLVPALAQDENSLMSYGGGRNGAGSCLFRDYQAIGINPANLGIFSGDEMMVTLGFSDVSGLFYSDALPKSDLISSLLNGKNLSSDEKLSIAQNFLITGNSFSGELMPVGIVLQFPKFGGIGFSWRERMTGSTKFSEPLADLVFNGINSQFIDTIVYDILGHAIGILDSTVNIGHLFNGSFLKYNWLREYNISYGTKITGNENFNWYFGAGIKFMQSNAIADITFEDDSISGFAAFSSLFKIDYANFTDPKTQLKGRLSPVGKGYGFDVGTTVSYKNKFYSAVSVSDIGSVKYKGNLVTINDAFKDSLFNFIGINEANIFTSMDDLFNAEGLFQYLPEGDKTVQLPTHLRIGAGWKATEKIDLAFDMIQPLNSVSGNLPQAEYAALVNFAPVKAIKLSTGFITGGFSNFDIPVGISFSFIPHQIWQLSIGTCDIVSWVKQNKPTISLNVSLLRFHYD
ncbi:MAG TPA: DUF5723 family protein [Chitinophagales bacterium]|nr:DUF5723 family protein [Chitinophagales bacterium]